MDEEDPIGPLKPKVPPRNNLRGNLRREPGNNLRGRYLT
jgi:hypothetical protein